MQVSTACSLALTPYAGYHAGVNASISDLFDNAGINFLHDLCGQAIEEQLNPLFCDELGLKECLTQW